jgi:hypothetical protein
VVHVHTKVRSHPWILKISNFFLTLWGPRSQHTSATEQGKQRPVAQGAGDSTRGHRERCMSAQTITPASTGTPSNVAEAATNRRKAEETASQTDREHCCKKGKGSNSQDIQRASTAATADGISAVCTCESQGPGSEPGSQGAQGRPCPSTNQWNPADRAKKLYN